MPGTSSFPNVFTLGALIALILGVFYLYECAKNPDIRRDFAMGFAAFISLIVGGGVVFVTGLVSVLPR